MNPARSALLPDSSMVPGAPVSTMTSTFLPSSSTSTIARLPTILSGSTASFGALTSFGTE